MEEQETADVCGSKCPREAAEREENPQEEQGHPLPSNCGVNWRTLLEKEDMQHWTNTEKRSCRDFQWEKDTFKNKALTLLHKNMVTALMALIEIILIGEER